MTDIVPILMYHHVSRVVRNGFAKYTVHPDALRAQLSLLGRLGYRAIDLDALVSARNGSAALPRRAVVITFDDGYAEAIEVAGAALHEANVRATFFIVAGAIGRDSAWLMNERGIRLALAGWPELRDLAAAGHSIGSHGLTHAHLPDLSLDAIRRELEVSRAQLSSGLGLDVHHVAYPHGEHDERVRQIARDSGYRSACTTHQAFSDPHDDIYALPRIIVDGRDRLPDFLVRLRTATSGRGLVREGPVELLRRLALGPAATPR